MKELLEYKIIEIGTYVLKVSEILSLVAFLLFATGFFIVLKRLIYHSKSLDLAKKFSISKLSRYFIVILSIIIGMHILGFKVTVLLAGSAALLVGLGFGLQNLFSDFISGIILLLDKALKVGDIIEVNGLIYQVLEINFRTTTVLGRDDTYVILPNSELTGNRVVNWTHSGISSRFSILLGVDYSTDVEELMDLLQKVVQTHPLVLQDPEVFVRFEDYGDSALIFAIFFYSDEVFRIEQVKSDLRVKIFKALKTNGIEIPFPQRVVHFKQQPITFSTSKHLD